MDGRIEKGVLVQTLAGGYYGIYIGKAEAPNTHLVSLGNGLLSLEKESDLLPVLLPGSTAPHSFHEILDINQMGYSSDIPDSYIEAHNKTN